MSQPPYQPYPQEPQSGQPGNPSSSAPGGQGYPPPSANTYPQPGATAYPQPGDGSYPPANQGFGGPPPAGEGFGSAPPKKRSVWKIIALVVVAIVVLCAGGIGTFIYVNRDKVKDAVEATKIKVVEPEKLGTRPKASDPDLDSSLDEALTQMKAEADVTGTAGAIYGDPQKLDILMLIAASSIGGSAQERYDGMVKGIGGDFGMTGLKDVDPGPLGGIAKCGDGAVTTVPLGICMWADSGSFAMLVLFNKKGADLQKDFVAYRGQIEQKS
jgi:hypothetical protein